MVARSPCCPGPPGIPERLLTGPGATAAPDAVTDADVEEFARTYSRPGGWLGAAGLYRSMLSEGPKLVDVAASRLLSVPVPAVGAGTRVSPPSRVP
jgi:hypothetical protein